MKLTAVVLSACFVIACNNAGKPVLQNSTAAPAANEKPQTAIAHSSENQAPSTGEKSKWTQSGDAIDTKKFDAAIAAAEVAYKKAPSDDKAKKALADAYLERANALTGARQYASALGDYRRTLKYDPSNEEAKDWIGQIVNIYESINRAYPKEGEEPPPLPYKGGKDEK